MERYLCIHGHFYQPPRENPWLETVERQDSAWPYHDWNERITAECYAPNATARLLDPEQRIAGITNNFARISFNFGPTLLAWMKEAEPEVHGAILAADRLSQEHYSGHGSAIAQAYNHMILPLGNDRDQHTQVLWGIRDFEHRFGRRPEGMWLAETAVNTACLEHMASQDIRFTILSPFQASRTRDLSGRNWRDVNGGRIDPTRPYVVRLPSGREIVVFFYDGPISQGAAFEGLLTSGERFAHRLTSAFSDRRQHEQLVHIATDGETYGHHHRHGEMALAYALQVIERNKQARLTNYGEYLERHRPTHEVQVHQPSAWSCPHGVDRWFRNCGCSSGGHPGWNQLWREPLRNALDWLRDQLAPAYESVAAKLLKDPWAARDAYISVILDRGPKNVDLFFEQQARETLSPSDRVRVLKLMELQRHAMLMYTSCGWFFDELSGIETVQVIQYAARAIQLGEDLFQHPFEPEFLNRLAAAKCNACEHGDGRSIYQKFVQPARIDWTKLAAHHAISSVFAEPGTEQTVFLYRCKDDQVHDFTAGKARLRIGCTSMSSGITQESQELSYAVLYMGEHNLTAGVAPVPKPETYQATVAELKDAFDRADFPQIIRLIDRQFGNSSYSLNSLFKDEQHRVLDMILSSTREDLENRYRLIAQRYTPLMRYLRGIGARWPSALQTATDFILQVDIRNAFESEPLDLGRLRALCEEARATDADVFDSRLAYVAKKKLEAMIHSLALDTHDLPLLHKLEAVAGIVASSPLDMNLWRVQNKYFAMLQHTFPRFRTAAQQGDGKAAQWLDSFLKLGTHLNFATQPYRL